MYNHRPIDDPNLQEALTDIAMLMRVYDVAGAVILYNGEESAYHYHLCASFTGCVEDEQMPLGMRIRIHTEELGPDQAHALAERTAGLFASLLDFGTQTCLWMQDLLNLLKRQGMKIHHVPFGGEKPGQISSLDAHRIPYKQKKRRRGA